MTTPKVREATMTTTPGPRTGHVHQHGGFCVVCGIHMAEARADVDGLVARVEALVEEAGGRCRVPDEADDPICATHSELLFDDECEDQPRQLLAVLALLAGKEDE